MMPSGDYTDFANAIEDRINMDNIKDRDDLTRRLEKAFKGKKDRLGRQTHEPTEPQIDALSRHYDIEPPEIPEEPLEAPPPRVPAHIIRHKDIGEREYRIELRTLTTIRKPTPTLYRTVSIMPTGFKTHQIRDVNTGRILRWEA